MGIDHLLAAIPHDESDGHENDDFFGPPGGGGTGGKSSTGGGASVRGGGGSTGGLPDSSGGGSPSSRRRGPSPAARASMARHRMQKGIAHVKRGVAVASGLRRRVILTQHGMT